MSTLKVNTIRHTGASSDAVTLATDGTCTAKITNNLSNRNLIINGAMNVAQRGTSSTGNGMHSVDRFSCDWTGHDEIGTQAQHALTSSDTGPWEEGFRHSFHITNGNQTGGAAGADRCELHTKLEAQDIANSGWNYTSASSYITLSFWVKSSVAQDFKGYLYSYDGTPKSYPYATGSLSANTWTKITKKIPGHADLQFDNNHDQGWFMSIEAFLGVDMTSNVTEDAWMTYASGSRTADVSNTWWNTNDATFEITGVQLEVGDVATDFEHRSYADELTRCERYFQVLAKGDSLYLTNCMFYTATTITGVMTYKTQMRSQPTLHQEAVTNGYVIYHNGNGDSFNSFTGLTGHDKDATGIYITSGVTGTAGHCGGMYLNDASCIVALKAEM